ncbi:hypothetical protein BJ138DRAFT_1118961 [Hygrophoropsis aurantiaca]|uniref:Uncharacterized protein n=1 Tax=Hygrophoropsis aurantiaca TaxID=72124 RepID=A0ACB7ZW37_9AGAM|nr:hypothetical protein BJ138DRAFT_1118961 [Hygrophoropsis aurantiaca]
MAQGERLNNWRTRVNHVDRLLASIHDKCTALDRLTGGTTLVLHHRGAMQPGAEVLPENMNADVYLNPQILTRHPELHTAIAEIVQLFIEKLAVPSAKAFVDARLAHGWKEANETPQRPRQHINLLTLPLVPQPTTANSTRFVFPGRPSQSLL